VLKLYGILAGLDTPSAYQLSPDILFTSSDEVLRFVRPARYSEVQGHKGHMSDSLARLVQWKTQYEIC